jgi:tetratricopeptide (TPR) repeat protein
VLAGRYDQAIEQLRKGVEQDSTFWMNHDFLGRAYEANGQLPEAIAEFQRALQLEQGNGENWSNLAHAFAVSSRHGEALKILDHLRELSAHEYVDPYFIATIFSGLRDKDQAFTWLERACTERSFAPAFYLRTDPQMDWLRSDPHFGDVLRRVGLW